MNRFTYARPGNVAEAVRATGPGSRFIAGGTNLVDLMKYIVKRSKSQGVVKYFNFHFLKKLSASRYC